MVEIIMTLVLVAVMLFCVCFIVSLILAKNTKDFHIRFGLLKGFDISGTFYDNNTTEHQK